MSAVDITEEFDLTDEDGEPALNLPELANDGEPGLIVSVEFDDTLSDPVIDNGKVRMPRVSSGGGFSRPVEFGSGVSSPISGVLVGMSFATGIGEIFAKGGEVYFPLAEYNGYYGTNVAGALVGVQYATGIDKPRINNGMMEFPETGGAEVQAAEFVGTITTSVEPGGLKGAEYATGITQPQASHGILQLPLADTGYFGTMVAGGVNGISYGSGISAPTIYFGEILIPQPTGEPIKGAKGLLTGERTWAEISEGAGGELDVAGCWVNGAFLTLSLGLKNGFLTFTLSA